MAIGFTLESGHYWFRWRCPSFRKGQAGMSCSCIKFSISNSSLLFTEQALIMGTSEQVDMGSEQIKRHTSVHAKGHQPDKIVQIADTWKSKAVVKNSPAQRYNTHERLFKPASNVERQKEDGCMNKLKIERSLKLRAEESKGKSFNILSGARTDESVWINSFGKQVQSAVNSPSLPGANLLSQN